MIISCEVRDGTGKEEEGQEGKGKGEEKAGATTEPPKGGIVILGGSEAEIMQCIGAEHPEAQNVVALANRIIPHSKRQIRDFEAAVLYALSKPCNRLGAVILEIGTALGFSCCVMALAAPKATIVTLNPKPSEYPRAKEYLARFPNVWPLPITSQDYLASLSSDMIFDFIFVDGGHREEDIENDIGFCPFLATGSLILFHDYTPKGGERACPSVFDALNGYRQDMGRDFDVQVIADNLIGMVGWRRQ